LVAARRLGHAGATSVAALPLHHRDPFDHLLIAQALIEKLTLVSRDRRFAAYGVKLRW
jgi:PIN domain nuclease of toxin-antitoxin system